VGAGERVVADAAPAPPAGRGRLFLAIERRGRGAPVNDQTRLRRDDVVSVLEPVGPASADPDFEPIEPDGARLGAARGSLAP
jgi:hypothetical protein